MIFDHHGYKLVALIHQLEDIERGLAERAKDPLILAPSMDGTNAVSLAVNIAGSIADEMGLESAKLQVGTLRRGGFLRVPLSQFLVDIGQLKVRIEEGLRDRHFYFVDPTLARYWGRKDNFDLGRKFQKSHSEIESAGNCLALGEPTACVFHLMRAMEVAVRNLSRRMKVKIMPQTTWRQMTTMMDHKITALPNNTHRLKRKRDNWSAARANLDAVGAVWRNNTMHPATIYSPSQALDVYNAVRVFMTALAEL